MSLEIGIPPSDSLVDRQFIEIPGPDGTTTSYQYDKETNTLIRKESQVIIPSFHGATHVAEDPIPEASQFLRGLMSAEDKSRLDSLTQTRLGVLGFQGAGFPDDGGFMQGDVILAAGSEFISLERVGNVIRFTVDNPIPLSCNCEECAQIFWIQDESETRSVRPPSCNGIMPDISGYGELKIYAYPESTIFNPNDPLPFFERKGEVPTFIFKRYENGNVTNTAQLEMVLRRRDDLTTNVGWSMTPGPAEVPECKWFMGSDREGRQITFEFNPESEPGLLGALLYNGANITRINGVITGYDTNVLATNMYKIKKWSITDAEVVGDEFMAHNVWNYQNPENGDATPTTLTLDKTVQLLDIGDIVELYQFTIADNNGESIVQSYFSKRPQLNPDNIWAHSGGVAFGDLYEARDDINHTVGVTGTGTETEASIDGVSDKRLFEKTQWGITNFENNLLLPDDGNINSDDIYEPGGTLINNRLQAIIDHSIPGLVVQETPRDTRGDLNGDGVVDDADLALMMDAIKCESITDEPTLHQNADLNGDGAVDVRDLAILATNMNVDAAGVSDRPIWLWDRETHGNFLFRAKIGLPSVNMDNFPPIDIITGGPIDHVQDTYMQVVERGVYETGPFAQLPFVRVSGIEWSELPSGGALRILTGVYRDIVWKYQHKIWDGNNVTLVGFDDLFPFDEDFIIQYQCPPGTAVTASDPTAQDLPSVPTNSVVIELLHVDFTAPACRLQFTVNRTPDQESVQLQVRAGTLSMSTPYELNEPDDPNDDFVRGFLPGEFAVSDNFIQLGFISDGIGAGVESNPQEFRVYNGGFLPAPVGTETEKWNDLMLMKRGNQLWVWWNNLLITPSSQASSSLPTPVAVNTPYFPVQDVPAGKVGLRMWPGTVIREVEVNDQNEGFNEFTLGQLQINC